MSRPSSETHNMILPYQQTIQSYDRNSGAPLPLKTVDYTRTDVWSIANRQSNKVRMLSSGTPWKPCSPYKRVSKTLSEAGECIAEWKTGYGNKHPGQISSITRGYTGAFPVITDDPVCEATGEPKAVDSNTRIRCGTELMLRVQGQKTSYGEQLAQLSKDAEDIGSLAGDLFKTMIAIRHGNFGRAASILGLERKKLLSLKSPAERWLQFQYGLKPLASDLYDTYKLFQDGLRKNTPLMHSVREIKDSGRVDTPAPPGTNIPRHVIEWESRFKMKVWYAVEPSWVSTLSQMGLDNPAKLAWDLTPYSFVVDWCVPVGNFLQALDARAGVTFIDGCSVYRIKSTRTAHIQGGDGYYDRNRSDSRTVTNIVRGYERSRLTGFPVPGIYFKNPFSSNHVTSALALFRQLLR